MLVGLARTGCDKNADWQSFTAQDEPALLTSLGGGLVRAALFGGVVDFGGGVVQVRAGHLEGLGFADFFFGNHFG